MRSCVRLWGRFAPLPLCLPVRRLRPDSTIPASLAGSIPRYSPPVDYRAADDYPRYRPLWTFYYYPRGIPQNLYDPKSPGYRYYPYYEYRSSYPQDQYDRSKVQRYPVR